MKPSCSTWYNGLDGVKMEKATPENKYCYIVEPSYCWYEILNGFFNFSFGKKCESTFDSKDLLQKYYQPTSKYMGFDLNKFWKSEERNESMIQKSFFKKLIPIHSLEDAQSKNLDVILELNLDNDKSPKFHIDIQRNETLVKERKALAKKSKSLAKNIIFLYSDAISRQMAHRKLPRMMEWLSKQKQDSLNRTMIEFFRYHTLQGFTADNLQQLYFGEYFEFDENKIPKDYEKTRKRSFFQDFKDAGYITGFTTSSCTERMTSTNDTENKFYMHEPADHQAYEFACDPNYFNPESPYGVTSGPCGITRRCMYQKDFDAHLYDYGLDFMRKYRDEKKILFIETNDAHEGTGEVVQFFDGPAVDFLENLEKDKLIDDDTIVIFFSDHGLQMNGIFRFLVEMEQVLIEISLPAMFISVPKSMKTNSTLASYYDNIRSNSQKLVTMHNVHHWVMSMVVGQDYKNFDKSLFANLPSDGNCNTFPIRPESEDIYCACSKVPRKIKKLQRTRKEKPRPI